MSDSSHHFGSEDPDARLKPADHDTWDTDAEVVCPYCGEVVSIGVDPAGGVVQTYVEDCPVCCQPWQVQVTYDDRGAVHVWVEAAQDPGG